MPTRHNVTHACRCYMVTSVCICGKVVTQFIRGVVRHVATYCSKCTGFVAVFPLLYGIDTYKKKWLCYWLVMALVSPAFNVQPPRLTTPRCMYVWLLRPCLVEKGSMQHTVISHTRHYVISEIWWRLITSRVEWHASCQPWTSAKTLCQCTIIPLMTDVADAAEEHFMMQHEPCKWPHGSARSAP